ncbi:MAG: hypothetical protein ACI9A7_002141 [Cyclobacteriaceae bacterium]|jgi:hypothetical protein
MIIKRLFFGMLLACSVFFAKGQFSNEVFHDGFLVSTEGDTISGLIKYDLEANIVQLVKNNIVKTYSSQKVFYFEIYDKIVDNYRQFYSILYNVNFNYEIPIIFEVLYEGRISLLAREVIVQESVNNSSAYWGGNFMQNKVAYSFYFLDKEGKIDLYTGKKNDLFRLLSRHSSELKSFIKKNRLEHDEIRDLIRIIAFYNTLES